MIAAISVPDAQQLSPRSSAHQDPDATLWRRYATFFYMRHAIGARLSRYARLLLEFARRCCRLSRAHLTPGYDASTREMPPIRAVARAFAGAAALAALAIAADVFCDGDARRNIADALLRTPR